MAKLKQLEEGVYSSGKGKKGQVVFFALMFGLVVILLALSLAPTLQDVTGDAMNADGLDCNNVSISNFDKAACRTADISLFYFVGGLIFIGAAILGARIVLG